MSKFHDLLVLAHSYAASRAAARSGHITYDESADVGDELRTAVYALEDEYRALMDDQEELVRVKAELATMSDLHPAVKPDMLVNAGALRMALNVLRRAGKDEVADELEKTAQPAPPPEQP